MKRRQLAIISGLFAIAAAIAVLWACDPAATGWMPRCWFYAFTGLQCPACGTMRAVHACLHGRFAQAWAYNYMLPFYLPLALAIVALLWRRPRSRLIAPLCAALSILLTAWMIIRNIA